MNTLVKKPKESARVVANAPWLNIDIFWLKDEALEDSANLPAPGIIATAIVEDLRAALAQFEEIEADLKE